MKKFLILGFLAVFSINCGTAAEQRGNTNVSTQKNVSAPASNDSPFVSSHSSTAGNSVVVAHQSNAASKNSPGESSPMARPIDVSAMTADIEKAEKSYGQKQKDAKARENLAEAYFVRAFALTDAAQYRAALGDFRKGLKFAPSNAEAKAMHDKIIDIFQNSLHREPPKEGEEPAPLPISK